MKILIDTNVVDYEKCDIRRMSPAKFIASFKEKEYIINTLFHNSFLPSNFLFLNPSNKETVKYLSQRCQVAENAEN